MKSPKARDCVLPTQGPWLEKCLIAERGKHQPRALATRRNAGCGRSHRGNGMNLGLWWGCDGEDLGEMGGESSGRGVRVGEKLVIASPGAFLFLAVNIPSWEPHQCQAKAGSVGHPSWQGRASSPLHIGRDGGGWGGLFSFSNAPGSSFFKLVFGKWINFLDIVVYVLRYSEMSVTGS